MRSSGAAIALACASFAGCISIVDLVKECESSDPAPADPPDTSPPVVIVPDAAVDHAADVFDASPPHHAFVTSTVHPGTSLGSSPDTPCNAAAAAAGLRGRFVAWLSFTNGSAASRLEEYGPWVTTRGELVATDKLDLTKGTIRAAIQYDERAQPFPAGINPDLAWTGAHANGQTSAACADWTAAGASVSGTVGNVHQTSVAWTEDVGDTATCLTNLHVYCFEQP